MYDVYILRSVKDKRTYVGFSADANKILSEHNSGWVDATKNRRPLEILMIEKCNDLKEAKHRELYWKSGAGRRKLKGYFIKGFPPPQRGARFDLSKTRREARSF